MSDQGKGSRRRQQATADEMAGRWDAVFSKSRIHLVLDDDGLRLEFEDEETEGDDGIHEAPRNHSDVVGR